MTKRYAIWDKKTPIITPIMEVLTPEQWMERYPVAKLEAVTVVCSAGEINGGFFGTLNQLVQIAETNGWDFSECTTDEEKLEAYEAYEDSMNAPVTNTEPTAEERIAAALEYQVLSSLPDDDSTTTEEA